METGRAAKERLHTQVSRSLLMMQPANFCSNQLTQADNAFQCSSLKLCLSAQTQALEEFNSLVTALRHHRIDVQVREDTPEPVKPDAMFPNNWVSLHPREVVLYPLRAENRRLERRRDLLSDFMTPDKRLVDLSEYEVGGQFLEGTGSLVLDRVSRKAYASLSPRTDRDVVEEFCRQLKYQPIIFSARYRDIPIYHTNVVMTIGNEFAIICTESMRSELERSLVLRSLEQDRKEIFEISLEQAVGMAGNCLQVRNVDDQLFIVMSEQARQSMAGEMTRRLERHGTIISADLTVIERLGGGSARCMILELF